MIGGLRTTAYSIEQGVSVGKSSGKIRDAASFEVKALEGLERVVHLSTEMRTWWWMDQ